MMQVNLTVKTLKLNLKNLKYKSFIYNNIPLLIFIFWTSEISETKYELIK